MELDLSYVRSPGLLLELEAKLPLRLAGDRGKEVEEAPLFLKLLARIAEKVEPDGRLQNTQRRVTEEKKKTEAARRKYLGKSLKLETLNEVILRTEVGSCSLPAAAHETALVARLREATTLAEVNGMLDLGEMGGEQVTTLCLDPADPRLKPRLEEEFGPQVLPMIEDVLFDKCQAVLGLLDPSTEQLTVRRAVHPLLLRLGDRVAELKASVEASTQEEQELARQWSEGYQQKLRLVQQVVSSLDHLVTSHYCGSRLQQTQATTKYLAAKTDALVLKLRCLELEILNATYTRDSVAAIKKISGRLRQKLQESEEEVVTLRSSLSQYQAAGPDFQPIVLEYARLQKEIEGKRWALSELRGASEGS